MCVKKKGREEKKKEGKKNCLTVFEGTWARITIRSAPFVGGRCNNVSKETQNNTNPQKGAKETYCRRQQHLSRARALHTLARIHTLARTHAS